MYGVLQGRTRVRAGSEIQRQRRRDLDPAYARGLASARGRGVEAICYACDVSTEAIEVAAPLPLDL